MKSRTSRTHVMRRLILLLSGLTAVAIAAAILFLPELFYASYGIEVAGDTALKNELKAPAGLLLAGGALMLLGTFRAEWTTQALVVAAAIYLSYGLSRFASFALDGMPGGGFLEAALVEIVIGVVALLALIPESRGQKPAEFNASVKRISARDEWAGADAEASAAA